MTQQEIIDLVLQELKLEDNIMNLKTITGVKNCIRVCLEKGLIRLDKNLPSQLNTDENFLPEKLHIHTTFYTGWVTLCRMKEGRELRFAYVKEDGENAIEWQSLESLKKNCIRKKWL